MSDANREQMQELVNSMWNTIAGYAQLGKDVVHLIFVEQAIHEPVFEGILGQRDLQFVGDPVQKPWCCA